MGQITPAAHAVQGWRCERIWMELRNAGSHRLSPSPVPMTGISIGEWRPMGELVKLAGNPRDNESNVPNLMNLIQIYGFVAPVCIWPSKRTMVAGHTRILAMERLLALPEERDRAGFVIAGPRFVPRGAPEGVEPGMVPVRYHEFRSAAEAEAYAIADNRSNQLSRW